jgi:pyruvate dehydrogenase E2 component (dihydrolipoamide acetyltransferase)
MSIEITMPRLSDTMETGTIIKWNASVGDTLSSGDVVADVETDKATMELAVYDDGVLARILVPEGRSVDVGTVIAVLAEEGEDLDAVAGGAGASSGAASAGSGGGTAVASPPATESAAPAAAPAPAPAPTPAPAVAPAAPAAVRNGASGDAGGSRLRISPVARRLAEEHGIDPRSLTGSGPQGRIIKRDVLSAIDSGGRAAAPAAAPAPAAPAATPVTATHEAAPAAAGRGVQAIVPAGPTWTVGGGSGEGPALGAGRVALSGMRQTIARRLVESKQSIPHYQVSMSIDMEPLADLRSDLNGKLQSVGIKLSVNDFLVRACALAMHEHPDFNASFDGDAIVYHAAVNIGIAISLPPERGGGLVVGVIREADQKSLRAISGESRALAEKARTRGLSVEDMSDSTFTLSNLGMFGVDHFTAIINPPNSAILAVGAALERPVVRNGQVVPGSEMIATLSNDHRVIDGAMAARFLQSLKGLLESPSTLLV